MSAPARKLATLADLLALPDEARFELVDGQLVPKAEANARHSKAAGALRGFIGGPFDEGDGHGGPGGWWILPEMLVSFPPQVYRPDLAGWHRARLPDPTQENPIVVIPDWCCEVLSPSNAAHDRVRKRRDYAAHGVRYYWLVDPDERVIEALELAGQSWIESGAWGVDSHDARIPPFDGIPLDVARLFLPLT
jgi:Uma2 family endonuclease